MYIVHVYIHYHAVRWHTCQTSLRHCTQPADFESEFLISELEALHFIAVTGLNCPAKRTDRLPAFHNLSEGHAIASHIDCATSRPRAAVHELSAPWIAVCSKVAGFALGKSITSQSTHPCASANVVPTCVRDDGKKRRWTSSQGRS